MKLKRVFFWIILFLPLAVVLLVFVALIINIYQLRTINKEQTGNALHSYLETKEVRFLNLPPEVYSLEQDVKNIFVFGASSVVVSDGKRFSEELESRFTSNHVPVKVLNFGIPGLDSYNVRNRLIQALDSCSVKPELVLIYFGHNDFNNAYDAVIKAQYPSFEAFLRPLYFFAEKNHPRIITEMTFKYYARLKVPEVVDLFQQAGLVNLNDVFQTEWNEWITDGFMRNAQIMVDRLQKENIPFLIITPISNLHARPYGSNELVTERYKMGLAEKDYSTSIELLKAAQNAEILTYDIRAKEDLYNRVKQTELQGWTVLHLREELEAQEFAFSDENFLDYFHMNEKTHVLVAFKIYERIVSQDLLKQREKPEVISMTAPE